jgi:hypothetical protein
MSEKKKERESEQVFTFALVIGRVSKEAGLALFTIISVRVE